jgi:hypothetical protein
VESTLLHETGNLNIGLGYAGGYFLTTGDNNIDIGSVGVAGESTIRIGQPAVVQRARWRRTPHTATFIAGIFGAATSSGIPVYVDSNGQLARFHRRSGSRRTLNRWITAAKPSWRP